MPYGPAVASSAMATALLGPPRRWRVLGVSTHVWWCSADDAVLVITDDRIVRLPNAVIVHPGHTLPAPCGGPATTSSWAALRSSHEQQPGGWSDGGKRRSRPPEHDPGHVMGRARRRRGSVVDALADRWRGASDRRVLRRGEGDRVVGEAGRLIGRGVGLTPEGDDVLSGVVVGYRHIGASIGNPDVSTVLDRVGPSVLAVARTSTTLLSYSLLRHAFAGEVAGPVGHLLRALTGRGDLPAAVEATIAIGHRSGPALARGVVAGVTAGCGDRL